ncbi:MAG: membrane-bound lytic murein transglycosylase C [Oleiphilaceae bacterium]
MISKILGGYFQPLFLVYNMKKMSKLVWLCVCFSAFSVCASSYEEWKSSQQADYKDFKGQYQARYMAFKDKVTDKWGDKIELSEPHKYVVYSDNLEQRTVLDYENNEIIVESLGSESPNIETALLELKNTSINQALANDPVLSKVNINHASSSLLDSISDDSSLDSLVKNESRETDTATIAPAAFSEVKNKVSEIKESATNKRINRVRISLPNNVFLKRASPFIPTAQSMSEKYDVDKNLILAIAQTESSFNPLAQSPIPAFGLMQIVPNSAGLDVNQALHNRDKSPEASLLFQPLDNIGFGTGYLHLLDTRYLKDIKDERSRLYCIIAAYNTGAGNVASVFHPKRRKVMRPAIAIINNLSSDEVYERLVTELPYKETRVYLKKVTKALKQYQAIDQS